MSWLTRVGVLLLLSVSACVAQEWHFVHSPLCGLLKLKGASVSNQSFTLYQAQEADECCKGLPTKFKGSTNRLGYFKVMDLPAGRYFAVFDIKGGQLVAPLEVQRRNIGIEGCGSESVVIKRDEKNGRVTVQSSITVD